MLKNLLEAVGSQDQDTVSTTVDIVACKVEIEQTQQLLQDFQKAHDEVMPKSTSSCKTSCPVIHSPDGIVFAARCKSVIFGLE